VKRRQTVLENISDWWKYEVKYWPVRLVCAVFGHRDLRSVQHWEICEYNYSRPWMEEHPTHTKGGEIGELLERWCMYCDSGFLTDTNPPKPTDRLP
jgi:hypothetical protein